ncbi:low molecular weight protein-tyrosine-phosphatase [Aurantiacibacter zhengii]|uniref:protein-tyrosine-phosphatase n=1 Tax=Aurantiacibacter zhengii TaxID=2307003 RepID=A0A418NSB1_9SPHN|nr:low molecular weight protein-tyrosine-phosphatase [Aurantiacibacter zhengii]RIV85832.1 low molecular weight phosphotyrosine protein phosphatase [Aurantiacibacter zhengii]
MNKAPAILFVCLGNICRSPLAEGALRAAAEAAGLDLQLDSAGTGDWHVGNPPDPRAIAVARENGVDITGLRARQVTRADFTTFDHIFALDAENLRYLRQLAPGDTTAEVALLLDMVSGRTGQPVADPYYGGEEGFAETWADVTAAAHAIVARFS